MNDFVFSPWDFMIWLKDQDRLHRAFFPNSEYDFSPAKPGSFVVGYFTSPRGPDRKIGVFRYRDLPAIQRAINSGATPAGILSRFAREGVLDL